MALSDWDPVAANNGTVLGVNIGEGTTAPSAVNNALRQICADVAGGINVSLLGTFLSSTTLAQARTALGVTEGSASLTAFGNLTNAANKLPYMTGGDAWSTTDLTSFVRTLLATGSIGAFLALLFTPASISASSGYITIPIGSNNFKIQWVDGTVGANGSATITFPTAYSSWSRAWCNGEDFDTSEGANPPTVTASTTTGATVKNGLQSSATITVFALGV